MFVLEPPTYRDLQHTRVDILGLGSEGCQAVAIPAFENHTEVEVVGQAGEELDVESVEATIQIDLLVIYLGACVDEVVERGTHLQIEAVDDVVLAQHRHRDVVEPYARLDIVVLDLEALHREEEVALDYKPIAGHALKEKTCRDTGEDFCVGDAVGGGESCAHLGAPRPTLCGDGANGKKCGSAEEKKFFHNTSIFIG